MIFGQDNDIVCNLLDIVDVNEDHAFFEALIAAGQAAHWEAKIFWADSNETHKALVLCRTSSIAKRIKVFTEIPNGDLELRIQQANNAGYICYTSQIGNKNVMIYY